MCTGCTCTDAPALGKDHKSKGARAREFTQTCASAPAHGPSPGTRTPTRIHRHVVLRHLGQFLSKKVGNENLIWESPGFIWRSPKGEKKIITMLEFLCLVLAGYNTFSRAPGTVLGAGGVVHSNSCRGLKHTLQLFTSSIHTRFPGHLSDQQPPSIPGLTLDSRAVQIPGPCASLSLFYRLGRARGCKKLQLGSRRWAPWLPGSEALNFANLPQRQGDVAQPLNPVLRD